MTPRVSVLLTVHNGQAHLQAALDSVLQQTWTDFEFLIIDDGSTDGTSAILATYAAADSRVRVLRNNANIGIPRSMNRLFGLAQGVYITRHDADDVSLPERLACQVDFLDAHPTVGFLATRVNILDQAGQPVAAEPFFNVGLTNSELQEQLLVGNCLCQGSVMFRASLLRQVGGYDENLEQSEDYDLWLRMAEASQLAKLDQPLYQYRYHSQSITRRRRHQTAYDHARVLDQTISRRFGSRATEQQLARVARDYITAAILKAEAGDAEAATACAQRALAVYPAVLGQDAALLEQLLGAFVTVHTPEASQLFVTAVFRDLPADSGRQRQQARWLSRVHMRQVFCGGGDSAALDRHLWTGLRHDPAWLFNRGVVVLALRAAARRLGPLARPPQP